MQPPDYGLIFSYGLQMTIVFMVGIALYTITVLRSKPDIILWYQANGLRLTICFGLFWLIGAGLVIVPNFATFLGSFGFDADKGTAAIAAVIVASVIKGKETSSKLQVEVTETPKKKAAAKPKE